MESVLHDERLVTVFQSRTHMANVEAEVIQSLLASAGIDCWVARENVLQQPVGNVIVKVLESHVNDAKSVLASASGGVEAD